MDDYIKRDKAIISLHNEIIKRRLLDDVNDGMLDEFDTEDVLRKLQTEDVQPVVRCRNCEHWDDMYGTCYCEDFEVHCQDYYIGDMHTEPDFFCGFGERGRRRQ